MEAVALLDKADVPFEDLVRAACVVGRSSVMEVLRKHPVGALMRRFREQVCVCARARARPRTDPARQCWGERRPNDGGGDGPSFASCVLLFIRLMAA
jgi:hypothetical protein